MVSCASSEQAMTIAKSLIDDKLVACAQISGPMTSLYTWNNELETSSEVMMHLKSSMDCWGKIEAQIKRMHTYEVPEILAIEIDKISPSYERWLNSVLVPFNGEGLN